VVREGGTNAAEPRLHVRAQCFRHRDFERPPDVRPELPVFSYEHFACFARPREKVMTERCTKISGMNPGCETMETTHETRRGHGSFTVPA
jgi:hypothetical protein